MQTLKAEFGEIILDAAGFVSTKAVLNAARLDYVHGFSFYLGNTYGVSAEQFRIAFDHGKKVMPNREGNSHEAYTWSSGPIREVDQARSIMDSLNLDWRNVPCIDSAVDWNPLSSEYARCDSWWHQYVDHALAVGFWGGYYGATAYGIHLIAQSWWPEHFPTWTWGGSGVIPNTAAKQFAGYPSNNNYSSIGVTVDESEVRGGLWMATSFEAPLQPEQEDMTPDQEATLNAVATVVSELMAVLTTPQRYGPDKPGLDWCMAETYDWAKKHAATEIADAVVARLPAASGVNVDALAAAVADEIGRRMAA